MNDDGTCRDCPYHNTFDGDPSECTCYSYGQCGGCNTNHRCIHRTPSGWRCEDCDEVDDPDRGYWPDEEWCDRCGPGRCDCDNGPNSHREPDDGR